MKTIEDAVIEFNGIWPEQAKDSKWFVVLTKKLDGSHSELKLDKDKFKACAKHLGYINGYRWGVEYHTNGKRPDLTDDVKVCCFSQGEVWYEEDFMPEWNWSWIRSFKITDSRYKPADTSYMDAVIEISESEPMSKIEREMSKKCLNENSWHERGEFPPVGVECEVYNHTFGKDAGWEKCTLLFSGNFICVYTSESCMERSADVASLKFRPIRTEREKVIDAANKIYYASVDVDDFIENLVKAEMLVLPPKKEGE